MILAILVKQAVLQLLIFYGNSRKKLNRIRIYFFVCICTEKLILVKQQNTLQIFEDKKVRALWDAEQQNGIYPLLM